MFKGILLFLYRFLILEKHVNHIKIYYFIVLISIT